jgi:hypothetical protein
VLAAIVRSDSPGMMKTRADSILFERASLRSGHGGVTLDFCGELFPVGHSERVVQYVLFWPAYPRVLPCYRHTLIVSAESNICAVAIAGLNGLVFVDGDGSGHPYSRSGLLRL